MRLRRPEPALFLGGIGLLAAAVTGGGGAFAGVEIPVISSPFLQLSLTVLGLATIGASFIPKAGASAEEPPGQVVPKQSRRPANATPIMQVMIHYHRPDGRYEGWRLYVWGGGLPRGAATPGFDASAPPDPRDTDEFGVAWRVDVADPSKPVEFLINRDEHEKDPGPDQLFIPAQSPHGYVVSGRVPVYPSAADALAALARPPDHEITYVTIHYRQPGGRYQGWGLYVWGGGLAPGVHRRWQEPILPAPTDLDDFGIFWRIPIVNPVKEVEFIIHRNGEDREVEQRFLPVRQPRAYVVSGQHRTSPYASAEEALSH